MEENIENIKNSILKSYLDDFKFKLDDVLSICESPIEKLMILQFYNFFQKSTYYIDDKLTIPYFTNIDFILEEIALWDLNKSYSDYEIKKLKEKLQKYNYRLDNSIYYKYVGFKSEISISENINQINNILYREIEIRPQYHHFIEDTCYRIDIAFILRRKDIKDNIIQERKIAIECDGYDYHSSPFQKREDDIRTRKLKRTGWKEVLRYSGSEIYSINDNLERVNYNFEEILDIIML